MMRAAPYQEAGWERALRVPAIGYRVRPWDVGTPQSLLCMLAGLAACAALLLAPLLCVAHCALMGQGSAQHAHHHAAHAPAAPFHCQLHSAQTQQPAPLPDAPLPRAAYELLPLTTAPVAAVALLTRGLHSTGSALAPQDDPAPPQRPPIG